jgi:hypothetical protein
VPIVIGKVNWPGSDFKFLVQDQQI